MRDIIVRLTLRIRLCFWAPHIALVIFLTFLAPAVSAQAVIPDWCRALPRPEYKTLRRVPVSDTWFEVYEAAPAVFAIYEPHQYEETISYLILGDKQAMLSIPAWGSVT